jgi:aspartyl-tRNA(Asn)/glutamyl-tRNA(Gln) amidotransferase subunit A
MPSTRFRNWIELDAETQARVSANAESIARRLEPRLKAFVQFERAPTTPWSAVLAGMPYAAKDQFVSATRMPHGGLAQPLPMTNIPNATVLDLFDRASARRIGYTAMTELAYEPSGYNSHHGHVGNPWNPEFISGGSSSRSAAAVASGSVVVALGSDTGGSLRIPAHCCGITAWKPTYGAVSTLGAMPLATSLDTIGLLARSASDMRAAHGYCMSGATAANRLARCPSLPMRWRLPIDRSPLHAAMLSRRSPAAGSKSASGTRWQPLNR